VHYQNLRYTAHKMHQMDMNVTFYIYNETIRMSIEGTLFLPPQVFEAYKAMECFKVGHHHMYVQAKKDPNQQWLPT